MKNKFEETLNSLNIDDKKIFEIEFNKTISSKINKELKKLFKKWSNNAEKTFTNDEDFDNIIKYFIKNFEPNVKIHQDYTDYKMEFTLRCKNTQNVKS